MRKALWCVGVAAVSLSIVVTIWPQSQDKPPAIPSRMGYTVCVEDKNGLVGIVNVPLHKPDSSKLDEFKASVSSAVTLVGRTNNRPDIINAAASIQLIDNPIPPLSRQHPRRRRPERAEPIDIQGRVARKPPDGGHGSCHTVCVCSTVFYVTPTGDRLPGTNGGGGIIGGCSGACGGCEKCTVSCP